LQAQRLLGLSYGVTPILRSQKEEDSQHFLTDAMEFVNLHYRELKDEDMVVTLGGSFGPVRGASYIEIATIGDIRHRNEERSRQ
jgi:pyruvate kinase